MLTKHKQLRGQVCNAWGGTILDPATGQTTDDKELDIFKTTYKTKFDKFKMTADIGSLEVFHGDSDKL